MAIVVISKLLIIPHLIFSIIAIVVQAFAHKRISGMFAISRITGSVNQCISFKNLYKVWKNDYYTNKNKPNLVIYKKILREKIGSENILIDDKSESKGSQPIEKIFLMNSKVIWRNLINSKFWRYIFRDEIVKKYYFKVN
ncbi:hypothetical protein N3C_2091 [Clostridium sp. N3C]|uniref:hypothetical protein n=1 Tax=Clostridium sp. N3C TaxID=1776758 RepID=UPI00092E1935|nr:hypothetical protein [Clostridium sp. N3C]SCN24958.1 hypothetical protein N3C_2091 [Clostridium sp. N3C]